MCLSEIWTDEEMESWLAEQPEVIEVHKLIVKGEDDICYTGFGCRQESQAAFNKANSTEKIIADNKITYWSGFHFFTEEWDATRIITDGRERVVKCFIKKDWITAMGIERWGNSDSVVIVASQAIFPHYPETSARPEDMQPFLKQEVPEPIKERG